MDPIAQISLLPAQDAFLRCPAKQKLLRLGNQWGGKTTAGLIELVLRCLGRHPYFETRKPPIECWVICASWSQSLAIQGKLWALLPKAEVVEGTAYNNKTGFGQHAPLVEFRNGSLIRFKTASQDSLDLAGATIDVAMFDEPPRSARVFSEIQKRVMKRAGTVFLTLTPVNAPVDWLREACDKGQVVDLHFPLTPEQLIPIGQREPLRLADGTVCDAAWIQQQVDMTLPHEVPVVIHGEWEMRVTDRLFPAFRDGGPDSHVVTEIPSLSMVMSVGIDHGRLVGKQTAILIGIDESEADGFPTVYVLDEEISGVETTPREDAEALLRMLERNGLAWHELDYVYGDRALGDRKDVRRKDNRQLLRELGKLHNMRNPDALTPVIRTAKRGKGRGAGAPHRGWTWMHHQMVRNRFKVHADCTTVIDCLNRWDGTERVVRAHGMESENMAKYKDPLDGLRYGLDPWIFEVRGRPRVVSSVRVP